LEKRVHERAVKDRKVLCQFFILPVRYDLLHRMSSPLRGGSKVRMGAGDNDKGFAEEKERESSPKRAGKVGPASTPTSSSSPMVQSKRYSKLAGEILTPTPGAAEVETTLVAARLTPARTVLAFGRECAKLEITPRVEQVYKLIHQATGALGGNGYDGAIYGELTKASMQKVINIMITKCEMNNQSRFIDVGSGLGKPNFHAAQDPAVRLSVGIELEHLRWQLAMYNLKSVSSALCRGKENGKLLSGVNFMAADVETAESMDPFTHVYMYDLGFPPPLQQSIARKFNTSVHSRYLVSYRPPHRVIHEYGYEVELVDQLPTSMYGSGESHMAYFYKRTNAPMSSTAAESQPNLKKLTLPQRPGFDEEDDTVFCDKAFMLCAKLAVGPVKALADHAAVVVDAMLHTKTKRVRKVRQVVDV